MEMPSDGQVVHIELVSSDPEATRKFFQKAFGLRVSPVPSGDMPYWMREGEVMPGIGMRKPMGPEMPSSIPYYWVKSVDESVKKITAAGGTIMMGKQEIPKMGWFAVYTAPGGIVQGIFEGLPPQK